MPSLPGLGFYGKSKASAPLATVTSYGPYQSSSYSFRYVFCDGFITSASNVTDKGICFSSTNSNPTKSDSYISFGSGAGAFYTNTSNNLGADTTYYIRLYATNSGGTAYSYTYSITTKSAPYIDSITVTEINSTTVQLTPSIVYNDNPVSYYYAQVNVEGNYVDAFGSPGGSVDIVSSSFIEGNQYYSMVSLQDGDGQLSDWYYQPFYK